MLLHFKVNVDHRNNSRVITDFNLRVIIGSWHLSHEIYVWVWSGFALESGSRKLGSNIMRTTSLWTLLLDLRSNITLLSGLRSFMWVLRATSHTRLRASDRCISSTLIGGKGGVGLSSLQIMFEGPTDGVSECKMDVKATWILTWHQMDHAS